MWIVELALRRPLSVAVMALLMLVLGALCFAMMNVDIFPAINLPVVMLVYNYPGLSAIDMERRIVVITERAYSTTVNGIDHIESESIEGLGLEKIYFHPGTDIGSAIAQLTATSQTVETVLPRGTEPPEVISYNAANVPVAQLNVYSETLSGQQLFDYGLNFIRVQLFTIPGFSNAGAARRRGTYRPGQSRSDCALCERAFAARRKQRRRRAERGDPIRTGQDGRPPVQHRHQHESENRGGLQSNSGEVHARHAGAAG